MTRSPRNQTLVTRSPGNQNATLVTKSPGNQREVTTTTVSNNVNENRVHTSVGGEKSRTIISSPQRTEEVVNYKAAPGPTTMSANPG